MSNEKNLSAEERSSILSSAVLLVAIIGCMLALYALYTHVKTEVLGAGTDSFCNINQTINCDKINVSEFSTLLGIPLAAYAAFFYSMIFFIAALSFNYSRRVLSQLLLLPAFFSVALTIVYLFISKVFIGALCIACMGLYLVSFLFLGIVLYAGRGSSLSSRFVESFSAITSLPAALLGVGAYRKSMEATYALIGLLFAGGIALTLLKMPEILREKIVSQKKSVTEEGGYLAWKRQPEKNIKVVSENGYEDDPVLGPPGAPITLVEFADFECPSCQVMFFAIERLLQKYEGKIRYVYKNYPLDKACNPSMTHEMHKNACFAARAARCAHEQERFWPTAQYLFSLEELHADLPPAQVESGIRKGLPSLGLDPSAFEECLASKRQDQKIYKDIMEGDSYGVEGTPTLFFNGKKAPRHDMGTLESIIEGILSESPQK